LIFEVTETVALASIREARAFGERISDLGCRFALDDFGAGFSSFAYLKHLHYDLIKIDSEFVRNCTTNDVDQVLIEALVQIARRLGKHTIAEGVGDDQTTELLTKLGVDYGQGYHLGIPAPLTDYIHSDHARTEWKPQAP
jgi:EAL domain-containing protein (putative c-di-GMP-specific phosphodiesterase class I)